MDRTGDTVRQWYDALQIAMMALDLQPGDEVITPSFTFIAYNRGNCLIKIDACFCGCRSKTFA